MNDLIEKHEPIQDCDCGDCARFERNRLRESLGDKADVVSKAMRRAWQLGQTYWQQADSESWSQNRKSDETLAKFHDLIDETRAAISETPNAGIHRAAEGRPVE